ASTPTKSAKNGSSWNGSHGGLSGGPACLPTARVPAAGSDDRHDHVVFGDGALGVGVCCALMATLAGRGGRVVRRDAGSQLRLRFAALQSRRRARWVRPPRRARRPASPMPSPFSPIPTAIVLWPSIPHGLEPMGGNWNPETAYQP